MRLVIKLLINDKGFLSPFLVYFSKKVKIIKKIEYSLHRNFSLIKNGILTKSLKTNFLINLFY